MAKGVSAPVAIGLGCGGVFVAGLIILVIIGIVVGESDDPADIVALDGPEVGEFAGFLSSARPLAEQCDMAAKNADQVMENSGPAEASAIEEQLRAAAGTCSSNADAIRALPRPQAGETLGKLVDRIQRTCQTAYSREAYLLTNEADYVAAGGLSGQAGVEKEAEMPNAELAECGQALTEAEKLLQR